MARGVTFIPLGEIIYYQKQLTFIHLVLQLRNWAQIILLMGTGSSRRTIRKTRENVGSSLWPLKESTEKGNRPKRDLNDRHGGSRSPKRVVIQP